MKLVSSNTVYVKKVNPTYGNLVPSYTNTQPCFCFFVSFFTIQILKLFQKKLCYAGFKLLSRPRKEHRQKSDLYTNTVDDMIPRKKTL